MSGFVPRPPLSARQSEDTLKEYLQLHEGIPGWMASGVVDWVTPFFTKRDAFDDSVPLVPAMQRAERVLRTQLRWDNSYAALNSLMGLIYSDEAGLDLLDCCLDWCTNADMAHALEAILEEAGSAWTVWVDSDKRFCLNRRVDSTAEAAARREMAEQSNAATHLRSAWQNAYGRKPDPSKAYSDAIKAVEAAARPVVSPKDQLATLGRMIGVMKATPQKWRTVIGVPDDVETVRMMMNTIWKGQTDRHGTPDPNKPPVEQPAAEAAVQTAVTLVHLFRTGAIHSVP